MNNRNQLLCSVNNRNRLLCSVNNRNQLLCSVNNRNQLLCNINWTELLCNINNCTPHLSSTISILFIWADNNASRLATELPRSALLAQWEFTFTFTQHQQPHLSELAKESRHSAIVKRYCMLLTVVPAVVY
jgi:hypothetical protein